MPIVQAGERILFSRQDGKVTAHIQIQYAGNAGEFGWILPLPSIPTLELGTDELFNQLISTTQPKYRLNRVFEGDCFGGGIFGGGGDSAANSENGPPRDGDGNSSVLVIQDSIGPYDYAVLRARTKDEMLNWLAENRYFVPAGTEDVVAPYIQPDGYFLALKLRSGEQTGDLQPVVVKYDSELPMIPIVLTSVAAQADMGIQVWMLGRGRAIPRNYFHTVINDALIDWFSAGANYNDIIIKATKEAQGRHTFVTEYAGPSTVMQNILDAPRRFGSLSVLAAQPDAVSFVVYMNENGYATVGQSQGGPFVQASYTSQMLSILGRYIPVPPMLATQGVTPSQFYQQIGYYLGAYRTQFPSFFVGYTINYKPAEMAAELGERVVTPTLAAGALFKAHPYLTRLYTTLSPEQMNRDPVFSENRNLPDVANVHEATLTTRCSLFGERDITKAPATLKTEQGWVIEYPNGTGSSGPPPVSLPLPASQRIETLAEEGGPTVVIDNQDRIGTLLDTGGCNVGSGQAGRGTAAILVGLVLLLGRRRQGSRSA